MSTSWVAEADASWQKGQYQTAINQVLAVINRVLPDKPPRLPGLQLMYYLFLLGDLRGAQMFGEKLLVDYPEDVEILENYAVILNRQFQQPEKVIALMERVVSLQPNRVNAWDGLASAYSRIKQFEAARRAGEQSLQLKDQHVGQALHSSDWQLPTLSSQQYDAQCSGQDVVAFSLWGRQPRYLRGALRNLLLVPDLYPGWYCWFYVDETVPLEFRELIQRLGGRVCLQPLGQSLRQKLCWRFLVANDPQVRRFLVRDADSVVSGRELCAVDAWLKSDSYFHVMRDWWTHTDLMLAGLWGGRAGLLPNVSAMLQAYEPQAKETANVDQWFLRDRVWWYVRQSCLIHDRCYRTLGAKDWPTVSDVGFHVGQNESATKAQWQQSFLAPWLDQYPFLQDET